MSILDLVFTQKPYIHIKSPDLTFYKPPPNNSILPRTFTLHTNTCQASKLKQNELCYAVALLVFGDYVLSFQENLSLFHPPPPHPPFFVVQALKAHWKAALRRCECVWNAATAVVCHLAQAVMQQTVPLQHWPELGVQILKHSSGEGGSNAGGKIQCCQSQTQRHFWILHLAILLLMTTLQKLAT